MKRTSLFLLVANCIAPGMVFAASPDFAHIETDGYGEVIAKPDMAEFSVQAVESALNAEQAKKSVDKIVTDFINRLTEAGIERKNIEATNLYLSPQYHYPKSGQSELVGYKASRRITVTIFELEKLNDYLDGALGDGINRIDAIRLKVKDRAKYQDLARQAAIKDANEKAAALAKGFNGQLKGVWKISYHGGKEQPVLMRAMAMDAKRESSVGYQDNSITIRDNVSVIYRFEHNSAVIPVFAQALPE